MQIWIDAERRQTDKCTRCRKYEQRFASNTINQQRWTIDARDLHTRHNDGWIVRIEQWIFVLISIIKSGRLKDIRRIVDECECTTK